jgi:hypothetical protein
MELTHEVRHDAPVDDVCAMPTDPAFARRTTGRLGGDR